MKEDYLWDKTGEDAELEQLENALKAFRYVETAPPALPVKVFEVKEEKPRRFFQFGFAFAAFASVIVILFAVWFQVSSKKIKVGGDVAGTNTQQNNDKVAAEFFINKPEVVPVKETVKPKPFSKPNVVKIRQNAAPIIRQNRTNARNIKSKEPVETLTAEEKYAFDQLMLALSITGSKLRIVKDKIQGIEEQNTVLDTAR